MSILYIFFLLTIMSPVFAGDLEKQRTAILKTDREWASAVSEGQSVDQIVSFWSDDARIFAPGMPVIAGKDAIRQFVQNSLATPGFSMRWETTEVILSKDGSLAYATGTNQSTFNDAQGKKVTINGKAVTVWRKESSGVWKCVIDIWNENPEEHAQ